ncbi:MAG: hypothetical protein RIQ59_1849 [Bacteroidota bacterium]|jgi:hypothetical protein
MKTYLNCFALLLLSSLCYGQTNQSRGDKSNKWERDINFKCDSLSRVYKVKVVSYKTVTHNGVTKHFICYYGKGIGLMEKEIPKPVK